MLDEVEAETEGQREALTNEELEELRTSVDKTESEPGM